MLCQAAQAAFGRSDHRLVNGDTTDQNDPLNTRTCNGLGKLMSRAKFLPEFFIRSFSLFDHIQ